MSAHIENICQQAKIAPPVTFILGERQQKRVFFFFPERKCLEEKFSPAHLKNRKKSRKSGKFLSYRGQEGEDWFSKFFLFSRFSSEKRKNLWDKIFSYLLLSRAAVGNYTENFPIDFAIKSTDCATELSTVKEESIHPSSPPRFAKNYLNKSVLSLPGEKERWVYSAAAAAQGGDLMDYADKGKTAKNGSKRMGKSIDKVSRNKAFIDLVNNAWLKRIEQRQASIDLVNKSTSVNTIFNKRSKLFKNHLENSTLYGCKIHFLLCTALEQNPMFLATRLVFSLEKRVPFRQLKQRLMKEITISREGAIKGVRITCSGRAAARSKKAQKARKDSVQWGQTSLNVFSDFVHFASKSALTPYGKIGVKVWICYNSSTRKNRSLDPVTKA